MSDAPAFRHLHRLARRAVGLAMGAFPPSFRRAFGREVLETFDDRFRDASRRGRVAAVVACLRTIPGLVSAGIRERLDPTHPSSTASPHHHRRGLLMDVLRQDLRFTARSLSRHPGFTALAVLTLALGIGASTAIFSVVNGVLLRPLPYPEPERLAVLWAHDVSEPEGEGWMSQPDIESVRSLESVEAVEGYTGGSAVLTGLDEATRIDGARVSGGLLKVFGLTPVLGRDIRAEDNVPDGPRVVVLGYGFWQSRFGGDPDVLGSTVEISERAYRIVGVAPRGFDFPGGAELWRPYYWNPEGCGRGCHIYRAVARVAEGQGVAAANADVERLAANLREAYPDTNFEEGFRLEPLLDATVGDVRAGLWIVLGAVGVVLLIACANVANLLLVRATTRRGEVAVRAALGAGRGRLAGQVLVESVVLAVLGALLGLGFAMGAVELIRRTSPGTIPRLDAVSVDGTVLLFAVGLTAVVTLLFGLSPALHLARTSVMEVLGRSGRGGRGPREARSRAILLAVEVGLSLVLLASAGLLTRSLVELRRVDLGFREREVVRFGLSLPSARYDSLDRITAFYRELEDRLRALPGVASVGSAFGGPLRGGSIYGTVLVEGRPEPTPAEETNANVRAMTPGYLETLGYPILRGRDIRASDRVGPPVALVNQTFVEQNFPGEDPLGQRVRVTANFGWGSPTWTIVGVVADVKPDPRTDAPPEIYVPQDGYGPASMTVNVRGRAGAEGLMAGIRETVRALDPDLPLARVETLREAIDRYTAPERFYLSTIGIFAALAVLLAAVGLYGVVAYLVSGRTREFGIRMALGARRPQITTLVLREAVRPTLWGLALGLAATLLGTRLLASLLFGVDPRDPLVLGSVAVLVSVVALGAGVLPARRATRVDPAQALRRE